MFDDDDPIKSYGRSKFSKIFGDEDLSGGKEDKYENYAYSENDYGDYQQPYNTTNSKPFTINEYGINRKRGLSLGTVLIAFIVIWFCLLMYLIFSLPYQSDFFAYNEETQETLSPKEKNELMLEKFREIRKMEAEYNQRDMYNIEEFEVNGEIIPTIYKYMRQIPVLEHQQYRYSDKRFGDGLTTIEIIYRDAFIGIDLVDYIDALEELNYKLKPLDNSGRYVLVKTNIDSNLFTMVIIENNRIIYGVGTNYSSSYLVEK